MERRDGKPCDWMESVMVAEQLHGLLLDMAGMLRASGRDLDLAQEYEKRAAQLREAINSFALDQQGYYKRVLSLDPEVEELGSSANRFGKIFLEPQIFAILSGVADPARAEMVLRAVEQNLDTEYGAMLCYPPFTDLAQRNRLPSRSWGIEKEPPAVKENGSIFMHLNGWLVQAYAMLGHGHQALAHYLKCLPENLSADQDRYKAEPYVYPEFVHGREAEEFGRGGHTWLTGTAPTMHTALVEYIFGLKPDYNGLMHRSVRGSRLDRFLGSAGLPRRHLSDPLPQPAGGRARGQVHHCGRKTDPGQYAAGLFGWENCMKSKW